MVERQPGDVGGGAWLSIMPWTTPDCVDGEPQTRFVDEAKMLHGTSWQDAGRLSEPKQWYRLPTDEERAAFKEQRASCKVSETRQPGV